MDSAENIIDNAQYIPTSSSTRLAPLDSLSDVSSALEEIEVLKQEGNEHVGLQLLASGGYNDVWLVSRPIDGAKRYVLRMPKEDALLPDQTRNEVACLSFARKRLPNVPVPQVYSHSLTDTLTRMPFIAEEYIEGDRLSSVWTSYDQPTKMAVSRQIAEIVVELAETQFDCIGGLMLDHSLGPTVEGMKLFKGRNKFHSPSYYNIGPYRSTKEYVLACYEKEIQYYQYASNEDIDMDLFEEVPKDDFIKKLQATQQRILKDELAFAPEEPFVFVHGDLHGRNIMMKDSHIQAILDWEFAGSYPLSELLGGMGVDVLEIEDEEGEEENNKWSEIIVGLTGDIARSKGWDERRLELLLGDGRPDLQKARVEMFP